MGWNYRVVRHVHPDGEVRYAIHETYYSDEASTPNGFTTSPDVDAESLDELRTTVQRMLACLDQPVLTPADFGISEAEALATDT